MKDGAVMKIVTVVGARPQFVKAAVLSRAFSAEAGGHRVEEIIVHTGQHHDAGMSDVFFREMDIPTPRYQLGISGGGHGRMTGQMLERIESVLEAERPDCVVVFGDTNSTLAAALSAAKLNIPVAHVEAGLRSFNMRMPEEVNRIMADHVSRILLCPTEAAIQNLRNEGLQRRPEVRIEITGDVMYDAALFYRNKAIPTPEIGAWMAKHGSRGFYLATIHRAENTDDARRLRAIIVALELIGAEVPIILPLHPRTRRALSTPLRNVHSVPPVGYFDMLSLLEGCKGVLTDSGGLQKEASFFEKPCVTLRDETELIELVEAGVNVMAGAQSDQIIKAERWMRSAAGLVFTRPYGDGAAGSKIARILAQEFA